MTKAELIAELAQDHPHLTQKDAEKIVTTIFNQITAALAQGQRVELRGFGNFTARQRQARDGRNPRNGATVSVGQKTVPFFKAGKELRQRVDQAHTRPGRTSKEAADHVNGKASLPIHLIDK
ncbi:MAG: integration host factor subunit beta [Betaproteobacteria bacterium]|nr:integration host factor subunit beta [Betaproteobacteria bacterium]